MSDSQESDATESIDGDGVNEHPDDLEDEESSGDTDEYEEWSDIDDDESQGLNSDDQSESDYDHDHSSDSNTDIEIVQQPVAAKLCPIHSHGEMTKTCESCAAAFSLIKDQNIIAELSGDLDSDSLLSRYKKRCDTITPSLTLASSTIQLAVDVFNKGELHDQVWTDLVRKFLTVPEAQHEILSANIQSEHVLRRYKDEKRFKDVFTYHNDLVGALESLRISQRTIFSVIERTDADIQKLRKFGEQSGMSYPAAIPVKDSSIVPRDGRSLQDKLRYSDLSGVFPPPDIAMFVLDNNLSPDIANILLEFLMAYRDTVCKKFAELYDFFAASLNNNEDLLVFYIVDLYSHCDAKIRNLIRNNVSTLFKEDIKAELLEQSSSKMGKSSGLLGG